MTGGTLYNVRMIEEARKLGVPVTVHVADSHRAATAVVGALQDAGARGGRREPRRRTAVLIENMAGIWMADAMQRLADDPNLVLVMLTHGPFCAPGFVGESWLREAAPAVFENGLEKEAQRAGLARLEARLATCVRRIIANSRDTQRLWARELGGDESRMVVVPPCPVVADDLEVEHTQAAQGKPVRLVMIGALCERKRQIALVRALAALIPRIDAAGGASSGAAEKGRHSKRSRRGKIARAASPAPRIAGAGAGNRRGGSSSARHKARSFCLHLVGGSPSTQQEGAQAYGPWLASEARQLGLHVIGDGVTQLKAKRGTPDVPWSVVLHGTMAQPQAHALAAGCDAFVFSSACETWGMAPVEAAMLGLPVVSSRVGELPGLLRDEATLWVEGGDASGDAGDGADVDTAGWGGAGAGAGARGGGGWPGALCELRERLPQLQAAARLGAPQVRQSMNKLNPGACLIEAMRAAGRDADDARAGCGEVTLGRSDGAAGAAPPRHRPPMALLAFLFVLYLLQGVPFGIVTGSLPVLLKDSGRASFADLGTLSLAVYPYAFKVFVAPIVDSAYVRAFGRRKSWVVPCTALGGVLLWHISGLVQACLEPLAEVGTDAAANDTCSVSALTVWLFGLISVMAVQDVAVDAWALTLLPEWALPFASSVQTLGMTTGNVIAYTGTLALSAVTTADVHAFVARVRAALCLAPASGSDDNGGGGGGGGAAAGSSEPVFTIVQFLMVFVAVHAAVALLTMFVHEKPVPASVDTRLVTVIRDTWRLARSPRFLVLFAVLSITRIGVIPMDTTSTVQFVAQGGTPSLIAGFVGMMAPVQVGVSVLAARAISSGRASSLALLEIGHAALIACTAAVPLGLWLLGPQHQSDSGGGGGGVVTSPTEDVPIAGGVVSDGSGWSSYAGVLGASVLLLVGAGAAFGNKLYFTAQGALFNAVTRDEHAIAGSALTLLNSVSNLGRIWPRYPCYVATEWIGFNAAVGVFVGGGVLAAALTRRLVPQLRRQFGV